jgi:hypothetical protein
MKYIFYALIITCGLFTACVEDKDSPCRERVVAVAYKFSDDQEAVMAYSKADTLVYYAGIGDSLYLQTSLYVDSVTLQTTNSPNNPDCPNNDYESHEVNFIAIKDSFSSFSVGYKAWQQTSKCIYSFDNEMLEISMSAIGAKDSTFLDSVELGHQMFYNVNKFENANGSIFYIHPTLGMLQLKKDQKKYILQRFNHKPWK